MRAHILHKGVWSMESGRGILLKNKEKKNIVISNYGNDSIALIQHLYELKTPHLHVLSVATSWEASGWNQRINQCQTWLDELSIAYHHLQPRLGMGALTAQRGQFPSKQFQWCAGLLKGLPINAWLAENDPYATATIMLATQKRHARAAHFLEKQLSSSDHFGQRALSRPLLEIVQEAFDQLLIRTGLPILPHRSLECEPCIHHTKQDQKRLETDQKSSMRLSTLENQLGCKMFPTDPKDPPRSKQEDQNVAAFYDSCGQHHGCGF